MKQHIRPAGGSADYIFTPCYVCCLIGTHGNNMADPLYRLTAFLIWPCLSWSNFVVDIITRSGSRSDWDKTPLLAYMDRGQSLLCMVGCMGIIYGFP